MSEKIINKLVELGGNRWEKYGKNRVYFNGNILAKFMGYNWANYNTGNICGADYEGERISNSEMHRILDDLNSKIYYDVDDDAFHYYTGIGIREETIENAIKKLHEMID